MRKFVMERVIWSVAFVDATVQMSVAFVNATGLDTLTLPLNRSAESLFFYVLRFLGS